MRISVFYLCFGYSVFSNSKQVCLASYLCEFFNIMKIILDLPDIKVNVLLLQNQFKGTFGEKLLQLCQDVRFTWGSSAGGKFEDQQCGLIEV